MGTLFGDFLRSRRDATPPEALGLPAGARRRVPGLRRSELAARAGISVEYLVRMEQGRDRHPSPSVVGALADALRLGPAEREHLRHLAKMDSATCIGPPAEPQLDVRPTVRTLLEQLEPGTALVTNRLGDVLAHTSGFDLLARPTGLLDAALPNLTRFVFTDERARSVFPAWDQVADERAFDLWLALGPSTGRAERFMAELSTLAGDELARRLRRHDLPQGGTQLWHHPVAGDLWLDREVLELPATDAQQLVVLLPADDTTADALTRLRRTTTGALRAVN